MKGNTTHVISYKMSNRAMVYRHLKFNLKLLIFKTHVYNTLSRSYGVIYIESEEGGKEGEEQNKHIAADDAPFTG